MVIQMKVQVIGPANTKVVERLYLRKRPKLNHPESSMKAQQRHYLPGNICKIISRCKTRKAAGTNCDTMDLFINLVHRRDKEINQDIHNLFDIVYNSEILEEIHEHFTDTYLICLYLYKNADDLTKLRPLGVPSSLRHFIASHVCARRRHEICAEAAAI